ncbi:restriction endonuclease subunit S [Streptomyces sp. NPDC006992]|uniref:restriction endonuclease subunit S n=1 Tax=Streptomyces sp. NPDC006992 TaxID=3155601 RepID=UPI0033D81C74
MPDSAIGIRHDPRWIERSFSDVTELLRRGTAPSYVSSSTVRVIGQRCVQSSGFQAEAARPHDPAQTSRSLIAEQGDVLLNSTGAGTIGRSCVFDGKGVFAVDSHVTVLRARRDLVEPRWLDLILRSPWGQRHLESHCFLGSTNQVELSRAELAGTMIPVPSLSEQRRIIEVIDAASAQERAIEASIVKLRSVRQGAQLAFMRRVTAGAVEVAWTPVRDVGEVRMGKQLSPDSRAAGGQRPYLRVANVFAGWIDYSDVNIMGFTRAERSVYGLAPGDILLNEGQSLELVGRSAIYRGGVGEYCFQNTLVRFRSGGRVIPEYAQLVFEYWLQSGVFAAISKKTTSIAHLGGDRFSALRFPLVSLSEQRESVASLARCDESIRAEMGELAKLRKLKQGLVNDLLSGRVAV